MERKKGFLVFVCSLEFLETLEKKVYSPLTFTLQDGDCVCMCSTWRVSIGCLTEDYILSLIHI